MRRRGNLYIVVCRPGREKRTLQDLLDLVFPYDPQASGKVTIFKSIVLLFTSLPPCRLKKLLKKYPIRSLVRMKRGVIYKVTKEPELLERGLSEILDDLKAVFPSNIDIEVKPRGVWKKKTDKIEEVIGSFLKASRGGGLGGAPSKRLMLEFIEDLVVITDPEEDISFD